MSNQLETENVRVLLRLYTRTTRRIPNTHKVKGEICQHAYKIVNKTYLINFVRSAIC